MPDTLVMLDLDGTIIDTSRLYFEGVPLVVKHHLGLSISRQDILPMWGQFAKNFFRHFARFAGREDEDLVHEMYLAFSAYFNENHNLLTTVYEGVTETLGTIHETAHRVGVITTRPRSRSAPVLQMPWVRHIDFFVWGDQVPRNKPFPDGLEAAIRDHAVDGGTCIYLGDNAHDIKAAQACHRRVLSAAALWDAMDPDGLMAANPDLAFNTFTDFADWIVAVADS